jgi:hypothetical protein
VSNQSQSRKMSGDSTGPTLAELTDFVNGLVIMGVDPNTSVRIERTPYYNQFDRGEWRMEITWPSN